MLHLTSYLLVWVVLFGVVGLIYQVVWLRVGHFIEVGALLGCSCGWWGGWVGAPGLLMGYMLWVVGIACTALITHLRIISVCSRRMLVLCL